MLDIKASLGESPVWSVDEQLLYWLTSMRRRSSFRPACRPKLRVGNAGVDRLFRVAGRQRFVAARARGIWFVDRTASSAQDRDAPYDLAHHRFNDGRADPQGRFWAGTMNENRDAATARLYCLDPDHALIPMISGITLSNGLAWSPDSRTMYHADTPARTISTWEFDPATGDISNQRC